MKNDDNSNLITQQLFTEKVWKLINLKYPLHLIQILTGLLNYNNEYLLTLLQNKQLLIREIDSIYGNIKEENSDDSDDDSDDD